MRAAPQLLGEHFGRSPRAHRAAHERAGVPVAHYAPLANHVRDLALQRVVVERDVFEALGMRHPYSEEVRSSRYSRISTSWLAARRIAGLGYGYPFILKD